MRKNSNYNKLCCMDRGFPNCLVMSKKKKTSQQMMVCFLSGNGGRLPNRNGNPNGWSFHPPSKVILTSKRNYSGFTRQASFHIPYRSTTTGIHFSLLMPLSGSNKSLAGMSLAKANTKPASLPKLGMLDVRWCCRNLYCYSFRLWFFLYCS